LLCLLPAGVLLAQFVTSSGLTASLAWLVISGVLYIAIMSALVSAVCGYMAGLIGSSNSPLSGIGILAVIGFALILVFGVRIGLSVDAGSALVAYALLVTAVVFAAAAIANNNLQDLKTGQLVDATPWKQQVALIVGVIAGAAVIPPVLDLLNRAYGFAGTAGSHHEHPLPAPQAGLISALAQGVIQNNVDWSLIQIGGVIGVFIIAADALLRKLKPGAHLSPLAVGLGIYLPTQSTLMVVVGAVAGWFFDQRAQRSARPEATRQLGVLLASGMIVGEGLVGVLVAALVAFSGKDFPLSIVSDAFADTPAVWLGGLVFAVVIYALYRRVARALR
jgi:putative OPT family oligopeptide transporter